MTTRWHPCAGCGNVIPVDVKWCGGCGGEERQQRANRIALFRDLIINPDTDDPVAPPVAAVLADFEANVRTEERLRASAEVAAIREFASGLLAYEAEHASGVETPTLIAVANDLLAIVGESDS